MIMAAVKPLVTGGTLVRAVLSFWELIMCETGKRLNRGLWGGFRYEEEEGNTWPLYERDEVLAVRVCVMRDELGGQFLFFYFSPSLSVSLSLFRFLIPVLPVWHWTQRPPTLNCRECLLPRSHKHLEGLPVRHRYRCPTLTLCKD